MNSARVRARKVLPTPVGPRKTNEPIGRFGSFRSARERRSALLIAVTASSWPMTRCFHVGFHREELRGFLLLHPLERHAGHLRDDVHHVVGGHEHFLLFPFFAPFGQNALEFFLGLLFLVAQRRGFFEILRFDRGFLFDANLFDFFFDFLHVRRPRHGVDPRARAGFVHHIDRFVRQETTGDIALGKFDRLSRALRRSASLCGAPRTSGAGLSESESLLRPSAPRL